MGFVETMLVAGLALKTVGTIKGGIAQDRQAKQEAKLAGIAGIAEEIRASEERTSAAQQETERREKGRRAVSEVISRTAGQGFGLEGTPLLQIADFLTDVEEDVAEIKLFGEKKATGAESRAAARRLQGMTLKQIGKAKKTEAIFSAGSSLLTGIGGIFK